MNLRKWQSLVRQAARTLYTDPLVSLIIDFTISNTELELYTFAYMHKLECQLKKIQSALNLLLKHGMFSMIEVKADRFKAENKLSMDAEDYKMQGSKVYLYYINVDIKFVLKARLFLLRAAFESSKVAIS